MPVTPDFTDLSYLKSGSAVQRAGWKAIQESYVFIHLAEFNPVLAGTLPLDLFTEQSDLDILCEANDLEVFSRIVSDYFHAYDGFTIRKKVIRGEPSVVANFRYKDFAFELFAQHIPVQQQMAYRHLIIEYQILQKQGKDFREAVMQLKQDGIKTEPAFAHLLQMKGDPYEALLLWTES